MVSTENKDKKTDRDERHQSAAIGSLLVTFLVIAFCTFRALQKVVCVGSRHRALAVLEVSTALGFDAVWLVFAGASVFLLVKGKTKGALTAGLLSGLPTGTMALGTWFASSCWFNDDWN